MPTSRVPETHSELTAFAKEIKSNLVEKYHSDGQRFIDAGKTASGLIYSCAGAVSLLLLVNGFDSLDDDDRWKEIVRREFDKVYSHVNEKGYDATPLVAEGLTKSLFSTQASPRYYYLDSVSWVLSFALHLRLAVRTQKLELEKEYLGRVYEVIKNTLGIICDAACPQGGWNFSNGCSAPHLYYSYAVSEALADFGDYVLGETPEIFGETSQEGARDKELIQNIGEDIIAKVEEKRKLTGGWLKDTFLVDLGRQELNPSTDKQKPLNSQHILLYYTYFVLDMLIICKTDVFYEDWRERINKGVEHGIYLSRIDFDRAFADKSWFENPDESSLPLTWDNHEAPSLIPKRDMRLYEPGLVPLSVRCNALYAYYIAEGEDRKMYELFEILFNNRNEETGLWDSESYNLMVTERAIEAIVDYNDYLVKFETSPARGEWPDQSVESALRAVVRQELVDYLSTGDGKKLFGGNAPNGSTASVSLIDENQLILVLTSALATGEQYMVTGKEAPQLTLKKDLFEKFRNRFSDFLGTMLFERLKATVRDASKYEKLRAATGLNGKRLFDQLGPWLAESPKVDLGTVFNYLIHEAVRDHDLQVGDADKSKTR